MPIKNPKEVFVMLLSDIHNSVARETAAYRELNQLVQDPHIKAAIEARIFLTENSTNTLNEVFKIIGQQPMKTTGKLREVFMEDFRKEINEIQSPVAKTLFVLAKIQHLHHLRMGEYAALVAAADATGEYAAGVLIESVLAQHMAFAERTRRLIRNLIEGKSPVKSAA